MSRPVRAGSETVQDIRAVPWQALRGRGDVGLIAVLTVAWIACTVLQLTHVICARFPVGALTLALIRTVWVSGTVWIGSALLRRGGVR